MSKTRLVTIVSIFGIGAIAAIILPLTSANAEGGHGNHGKKAMKKELKEKPLSLEEIHYGHLPMVSKSIDKAIKAIGAGNNETALVELRKAQKMLAAIKGGIGRHVRPKFANVSCPIMGLPIDTEKVGKSLIRDHKGEKIAFCCGGCPVQWDKLTDAEKDAKLAKVKPAPKPKETPSERK